VLIKTVEPVVYLGEGFGEGCGQSLGFYLELGNVKKRGIWPMRGALVQIMCSLGVWGCVM
jgi:hypothetical protein